MSIVVKRCTSLPELFAAIKGVDLPIRYLAGGTDLMVELKENPDLEEAWFDISDIPELKGVRVEGEDIIIGAVTPFDEIHTNEYVQKFAACLAEAAANVGSPQIRARGTIGGNVANGSPKADTPPALISLGAKVNIVSERGMRTVEFDDFHLDCKVTVLAPGEIIHSLSVPMRKGVQSHWKAIASRKALAISKLSLAASVVKEGDKFSYVRLGLGAAGAKVMRAPKTEALLMQGGWNPDTVAEAVRLIQTEVSPRANAAYRKAMSGVLLGDVMNEMLS